LKDDHGTTLVEAVAAALKEIMCTGYGLDEVSVFESLGSIDKCLPRQELTSRVSILGDHPLFVFILERIQYDVTKSISSRWLLDDNETRDTVRRPLTSFDEYADLERAARQIVEEFYSLPWKYIIRIDIPSSADSGIRGMPAESFYKGDKVKILRVDHTQTTKPHNALLSYTVSSDGFAIQAELSGFIGRTIPVPTNDEIQRLVRSFFGLGIALGVFKVGAGVRGALYSFGIEQIHSKQIECFKIGQEQHVFHVDLKKQLYKIHRKLGGQ